MGEFYNLFRTQLSLPQLDFKIEPLAGNEKSFPSTELLWADEDSGIFEGTIAGSTLLQDISKEWDNPLLPETTLYEEHLADGDIIILSSSSSESSLSGCEEDEEEEDGRFSPGEITVEIVDDRSSSDSGSGQESVGEVNDEYGRERGHSSVSLFYSEDSPLLSFTSGLNRTEDLFSDFDSCSEFSDHLFHEGKISSCQSVDEIFCHPQNHLVTWSLPDLLCIDKKFEIVMRSNWFLDAYSNGRISEDTDSYQDDVFDSSMKYLPTESRFLGSYPYNSEEFVYLSQQKNSVILDKPRSRSCPSFSYPSLDLIDKKQPSPNSLDISHEIRRDLEAVSQNEFPLDPDFLATLGISRDSWVPFDRHIAVRILSL